MKFSIASLGEEPAARFLEFVRLCELLGYDSFCHADEKWTRDVWVRLALASAATSRIGLGITVTDPYTRHPALTAQAGATLGEASGGRLRIVVGAGSHFETLPGYASVRPAIGIRESIELMRRLWAGERVTLNGEVIRFLGGKLDFSVQPQDAPEVWVAGRGKQVLATGGEVADGVLIGSFATVEGIRFAKGEIARGMARRGRAWDDVRLASWLYVSILEHEDDPVPDDLRRGISHALWSSREIVWSLLEGLDLSAEGAFTTILREAPHEWTPEIMAEVRRLIPRQVMNVLALVGTKEQVAERIRTLEAEGISEIVAWPFPAGGVDVEDFAVQFAHEVFPLVRGRASRGAYQLVD